MMTASIGARQWWRWCQSTHPMPGNNPTAVDLSWPSLSSSIPLLLSAPALSLSLSLATALARTTLFVEHLLQSCYFFHFCSHYLVPLSISFCHSALALNRRTPLLVSNSSVFSTSWAGFCPSAGMITWCLSFWAVLLGSLASEALGQSWRKAFWFSAFQFIKHCRWAALLSAWLLSVLALSAACLLPPSTIFPSAPGSSGSMRGSKEKSVRKKKLECKSFSTGWPPRDGVKGCPVIGPLYVVGTPTGREERWAGWENDHCFKQRGKEK